MVAGEIAGGAMKTEPEWLALGPASRLVGVDPDTLRRWADTGRVVAFSTPGGHRRFSRAALAEVVAGRTDAAASVAAHPLARLGATPQRLSSAYRRSYGAPRRPGEGGHARSTVRPPERAAFRADGRALVAALVRYLDAPDDDVRGGAEAEATALAEDLGRRLGGIGISLTESVALFVAARRPFLAELGTLARGRGLSAPELGGLLEEASAVLDRLLLGFLAAHQVASQAAHSAAAPTPATGHSEP